MVVKVIQTDDADRYNRAKREMNLFQLFFKNKRICTMVIGKAIDAANGLPGMCACVLQCFKLGTVQTLLDTAHPEFTELFTATKTRCLRFKQAVAMAKDVLEGLECMHANKVVHRDIKPGNICVEIEPSTTDLRFTIIDLGAAVGIQPQSHQQSTHSLSGTDFTGKFTSLAGVKLPLGTVPFMSPEHIDEFRTVDGRSDLFSLGVTMYKCLCGRFPFVQPSAKYNINYLALKLIQAYASAAEADPLKLSRFCAHPRAVDKVVEVVSKSLRKEPMERYQSAKEMRENIGHIDRCWVRWLMFIMEISMHA